MGGLASILIVDDNPKFLADALPMYGYDITVAEDGLEALKILFKQLNHLKFLQYQHFLKISYQKMMNLLLKRIIFVNLMTWSIALIQQK